jgi:hypothetical protein
MNSLDGYVEMMIDNQIDLDVLTDLSEEVWEEMGILPADMTRLLNAIGSLHGSQ